MSLSRFFIDRPIFAWVIAILVSLIGTISIISLPIAQWPSIAPPPITLSFTYPGATADTVQRTVVDPISQNLYGLDNLEPHWLPSPLHRVPVRILHRFKY